MRKVTPFLSVICLVCVGLLSTAFGCSSSGGGGRRVSGNDAGNSSPNDPMLGSGVTARLSSGVTLPSNEGPELVDPEIDDSIVLPPAVTDDPVAINPGEVVQVQIAFEAPEGNVVAAGIRFGDDGPIRQIELPEAEDQTAGTLSFDMQIPADICDDLANICHEIICNEFAVTSAGKISRANVVQMGVVCGNGCDEPTCQELLMCEMPPEPDAGGQMPNPGGDPISCSMACATITSACADVDSATCIDECEQDEAHTTSCGEQDAWQAMLSCCEQATLTDFCAEGGFDACQKGACEDLRPAGAADGCSATPAQ